MSAVRNRGLFTWISALLLCGTATGQQNMLWRGVVKPEAINVYQSASTNEHVNGTLRQGDAVDVVLQVSVSGSEWCRVTRAGASEPVGFVLCLNLQQGAASPEQVAHTQQVASQSHPLATVAAPSVAPSIPARLTNKDVLDLYRAGLPEEVLVAKIKSSASGAGTDFDTSPNQLKALKATGLGDGVILAMVEAPVNQPQVSATSSANPSAAEKAKPVSSTAAPLSAPKQQSQQGGVQRPCIILKRMGPADEITSHLYSFGIRGKQFQSVEGTLPQGISFHGRLTDHDVRTIENKGGKVVIIEPKYNTQDLDHARQECHER